MKLPRITIITPCRNGERFIAEAIESVERQHYPDLEHLVLDGASTDGTLALLARHPSVEVVSEPDDGAHDAMNKGIARSTGEVIGFLNVDDLYPDDLLVAVANVFASDPQVDAVTGQTAVFEDDERGRHLVFLRTHAAEDGLWLPELTFGVPGFCGWFFRRRVFERVGNFNNEYFMAGDRQFLMRMALSGMTSRVLGRTTICYRLHPGSQTINREARNRMILSREYFRMAQDFSRADAGRLDVRACFLAWNAFEGAKLIIRNMLAGRIVDASRTIVALSRHNALWPLSLVHGLALRRAVHRLDRGAARDQRIAVRHRT
jgi:glycosyltransferase involved in cell wall biosynthesis